MFMPLVSVVLATFEQPNALAFALLGYGRQSFKDFEVVVADDGSGPATRKIVDEFRALGSFPLKHVRQENAGFRRAKITNEGIRASSGRVILISDGDCVPHRDFVRAHAEACAPGAFCAGGYVRLNPDQSRALTRENVAAGDYEAACTPAELRRFRWTHWKNRWALLFGRLRKPKVYGCNLSADRDVLYAVNGLDENFDGFGKEDSDLRNRLRRHGARPVSLWGKAWVYHVEDVVDPACRERRIPRGDPYPYYDRPDVPVRAVNGLVKAP